MSDGAADPPLAGPLRSTFRLLCRAYPDGVPERDCDALVALLGVHLPQRALGLVLSRCSPRDGRAIARVWARVSCAAPAAHDLARVQQVLDAAGYEAWLTDEEE